VAGSVPRRALVVAAAGVLAVSSAVSASTVMGGHPALSAAIAWLKPPATASPTAPPPTDAPTTTPTNEPPGADPRGHTAAGPIVSSTTRRPTTPAGSGDSQPAQPPGPAAPASCSVGYTFGGLTFNPTGQETTFTEYSVYPSVGCPGPPRRVFWAAYSWRADGSRKLFASETFMLSAEQPVHHTVMLWDDFCNGGHTFAFGDVPLPETIPAGVFSPGPMYDPNTSQGYFLVTAPPVAATCTFPSSPA